MTTPYINLSHLLSLFLAATGLLLLRAAAFSIAASSLAWA